MKRNDVLFLMISSFVVVVVWISVSVYSSAVTSTISETLGVQIIPISPAFDTPVIEALKKRRVITPSNELPTTASEEASLSPTPITPPTPSTQPLLPTTTQSKPTITSVPQGGSL